MKAYIPKHLITLFVAAVAVAFAGPAAAHGDHHGARLTLTWTVDGTNNSFTVDTPMNPPLRFVKMNFMAKTGMPVREADDYVVEKLIPATTAPVNPLPPGVLSSGRGTSTSAGNSPSYEQLDDTKSLADQGIVAGDTLVIKEVPDDESSEFHHGHHFGWGMGHHQDD